MNNAIIQRELQQTENLLLAIDVGNTNIVIGVYKEKILLKQWRISTYPSKTSDEYVAVLTQLMTAAGIDVKSVNNAIIASVVPTVLFDLKKLCRNLFGCEPLIIGESELEVGIKIKLARPKEVGADTIANAAGSYKKYGGNLIVVDFGTATTFRVLDEEGSLIGGAIAPGINLALNSLHSATALLPKIAIKRPEKVIGDDTVPAMQTGIYWGYIGLIEGIITRMQQERGVKMTTIVTGGLSSLFFQAIELFEYHDPDLTLDGLMEIYHMNIKK